VAKRYGKLPSEVLKFGDTADVKCAELAVQYENYLHKKAEDESKGIKHTEHSQEELLNMINRVRTKEGNGETQTKDK
jgi:hypothetical protein